MSWSKTYALGGNIEKTCQNCGATFLAVSAKRRYCSYRCKRQMQNARHYQQHRLEIIARVIRYQRED